MIKLQLPNLNQTLFNTFYRINISNSNNLTKFWIGIHLDTPGSHQSSLLKREWVSEWVSQWVTSMANDRSRVLLYTGSDQPISSSVCLFLTLVAQQLFISSARSLIAIPSHTDFLLIHPPQQTPPHPTTLCQITPVLSNNIIARQALTQHISWPKRDINGNNLAPLGHHLIEGGT